MSVFVAGKKKINLSTCRREFRIRSQCWCSDVLLVVQGGTTSSVAVYLRLPGWSMERGGWSRRWRSWSRRPSCRPSGPTVSPHCDALSTLWSGTTNWPWICSDGLMQVLISPRLAERTWTSGLLETVKMHINIFKIFLNLHFHCEDWSVFILCSVVFGRSSVRDGAAESSQIQTEQSGDEAAAGGRPSFTHNTDVSENTRWLFIHLCGRYEALHALMLIRILSHHLITAYWS